jgi:hypothetical protein
VTTPQVTSIYAGQDVPVGASWVIPDLACPWGTEPCEFSVRACADVTVGAGPVFSSWDGEICEKGETSCIGSHTSNNCSPWSYVFLEETDAPPPSAPASSCRPIPSISRVGRTVTWTIDTGAITGGEPPLEYKWEALPSNTGADALCGDYNTCSSTGTDTKVYDNASPSTKRAQVTIRDAGGQESSPIVCTAVLRMQRIEEF